MIAIQRARGDARVINDIINEVAGAYPSVIIDRDMDAGACSCGMVAGFIKDIPTVKELINRIITDVETIIRQRWPAFSML